MFFDLLLSFKQVTVFAQETFEVKDYGKSRLSSVLSFYSR